MSKTPPKAKAPHCAIEQRIKNLVLMRRPDLVDQLVPPCHQLAHSFVHFLEMVAPVLIDETKGKRMDKESVCRLLSEMVAVSMEIDGTADTESGKMAVRMLQDVLNDKELS